MQFAVRSPGTSPDQWLPGLQQLPPGFTGYSLDCPYPLPDIPAATVTALRAWREERGVTYFIHTPVGRLSLGSLDPVVRQLSLYEVKRAIALAAQVGAALITVHPTPASGCEQVSDQTVERLEQEALEEICTVAARYGVIIALENMPPGSIFAQRYSDFSGLLALLQEVVPLGITLDVGHAHLAHVSLPGIVHRLGHRLCHIHVHDNDRSGDLHLPVGQGTVDWLDLLQALVHIGYQGFMELEFQGHEAHMASKRYLEGLL